MCMCMCHMSYGKKLTITATECNVAKGGRFPSSLISPPFPRDQLVNLGRAPLALLGHELLELTGAA